MKSYQLSPKKYHPPHSPGRLVRVAGDPQRSARRAKVRTSDSTRRCNAAFGSRAVRLFAEGQGLRGADLEAFVRQVDAANLWHFARRPLDLDWMVQFWRTHRRLGTLAEMLETSLAERLKEPNSDRVRHDPLDVHA